MRNTIIMGASLIALLVMSRILVMSGSPIVVVTTTITIRDYYVGGIQ